MIEQTRFSSRLRRIFGATRPFLEKKRVELRSPDSKNHRNPNKDGPFRTAAREALMINLGLHSSNLYSVIPSILFLARTDAERCRYGYLTPREETA
jgi:hypothetical protein